MCFGDADLCQPKSRREAWVLKRGRLVACCLEQRQRTDLSLAFSTDHAKVDVGPPFQAGSLEASETAPRKLQCSRSGTCVGDAHPEPRVIVVQGASLESERGLSVRVEPQIAQLRHSTGQPRRFELVKETGVLDAQIELTPRCLARALPTRDECPAPMLQHDGDPSSVLGHLERIGWVLECDFPRSHAHCRWDASCLIGKPSRPLAPIDGIVFEEHPIHPVLDRRTDEDHVVECGTGCLLNLEDDLLGHVHCS